MNIIAKTRVVALLLALIASSKSVVADDAIPLPQATAWPEADKLFRNDPRWVGGDDATSVDLGNGRIAWLFADSFVDPTAKHKRPGSKLIRNSIGIQQGANPAKATIKFYWRDTDGAPSSFFAEKNNEWYWPGGATLVDKRLIVFLMRVHEAKGSLGFAAFGAAVAVIDNLPAEPNDWQIKIVELPANQQRVILGSGCTFVENDHLYAFGATEPGKHDVYVTRWPIADIAASKFDDPEWWTGDSTGWGAQSKLKSMPQKCFADGQTEFTLQFVKRFNRYLEFQATGFGGADLDMRSAAQFTGPWSKPQTIYAPPEKARAKIMIYAAKAHPELAGADIVLTYNTNSFDFNELINDDALYYPRFVRLTFPR
jgi:hypothetical protein